MNNLSNGESCIGQITNFKKEEFEDEVIDKKQQEYDCKILDAEINYYTKELIKKVKLRYSVGKDKETYDQLVNLNAVLKN